MSKFISTIGHTELFGCLPQIVIANLLDLVTMIIDVSEAGKEGGSTRGKVVKGLLVVTLISMTHSYISNG
jgi:hypothetical protein